MRDSAHNHRPAQAIDELGKDRTQIVIAHRLSTIRDAQQIIVLQAGKIAEAGTHAELLRPDAVGLYRDLWYTQLMEDRQKSAHAAADDEGEAKAEDEGDDNEGRAKATHV